MKTTFLATVAAVALIAGADLASAQRQEAPNPAPSAQQQTPAEKTAPKGPVAPDRAQMKPSKPETTGQANPPNAQPKMGEDQPKASPNAQPKTAQPKNDQPKNSTAQQPNAQPKNAQQPQPNNSTAQQPNDQTKKNDTAQKPATPSPTTGQATRPAGDSVTLNAEQKTKLRTTVVAKAPKVTNVNFQINVGTVVPRTVHVVAVPPTLIEIHPAWRGYMYFVVNDQIIIVEPRTLRIVAVLDV